MKKSSELILRWYNNNKRELPWRENKDPYSIWLSEIILQQTRVDQGLPYYQAFLKNYPKIKNLAEAPEDDVMKLWQGLGYYSRARNLHKTAKMIVNDWLGNFPKNSKDLKKMPGIGDYTAAAVSSIAYGERIPVLDGNVYRVLSRLFDIDIEIGRVAAKKYFSEKALSFMGNHDPGDFNQAVMEFGAIQCTPVNPDCQSCVLIDHCRSYALNNIDSRPIIKKKKPVKNRFLNYFLIHDGAQCYVNKRSKKDIWIGLYDFPILETSKPLMEENMPHPGKINTVIDIKHLLTHQRLNLRFFVVQCDKLPVLEDKYQIIDLNDLVNLPVPKPIENFLSCIKL